MAEARLGEKQEQPADKQNLTGTQKQGSERDLQRKLQEIVEEKPPTIPEKPVKIEEKPAKIEEKPKQVEEKPKQVEEKPKKVEEKAKKVEERKMDWLEDDQDIDLVIEDDVGPPIAPASTTSNSFAKPSPSIPAMEDEWDKATAQAVEERSKPKPTLVTSLITHSEVWRIFEQMDIRQYREPEAKEPVQKVSWMSRCFRTMPVELEDGLKEQRDRIIALLHVAFNDSPLHLQILMSVWKFLMKSKEDCGRYGHHWDRLGFQGADPATDLRSMGIYGLLQILFFVSNLPDEADAILTYSRQSGCNFPFAAVSLNITKMTIETLREGKLNKLIVRCGEAYRTVRTR